MIKPKAKARPAPSDRVLTFKQLKDHGVPFTRSYLDRLERKGAFPRRFAQGTWRVVWLEREIDNWRLTTVAQRSHKLGVLGSHGKTKGRGKYRGPKTNSEPDPLSGDKP